MSCSKNAHAVCRAAPGIIAWMACLTAITACVAAPLPYALTVDPDNSTLVLGGIFDGYPPTLFPGQVCPCAPWIPQSPPLPPGPTGSDGQFTNFTGTIHAVIDDVAQEITFTSGAIDASISGDWLPERGGGVAPLTHPLNILTDTPEPADYGVRADGGVATVAVAIRDLIFDMTSPTISGSGIPNVWLFPSTLTLPVTSGVIDFNDTLPPEIDPIGLEFMDPGQTTLEGVVFGQLSPAAMGQVSISEAIATVTLPIATDIHFTTIDDRVITLSFGGQIVARGQAIPEPSAITMAILGVLGTLAVWGRTIRPRRNRCGKFLPGDALVGNKPGRSAMEPTAWIGNELPS